MRRKQKKKIIAEPEAAVECLLCTNRYSREDVLAGLYQLDTMVCSKCYATLQRMPHAASCFGKPTYVQHGSKSLGYDPETEECSSLCADRMVCRLVVTGKYS